MAYQEQLVTITLEADADLSAAANQYRGVNLSADGQAALAGANARIVGVLQNDPAAVGRAAEIGIAGVSKVRAGAAFAINDFLETDAAGDFITAAGAGSPRVARALAAAGAAGDIVSAIIGYYGDV